MSSAVGGASLWCEARVDVCFWLALHSPAGPHPLVACSGSGLAAAAEATRPRRACLYCYIVCCCCGELSRRLVRRQFRQAWWLPARQGMGLFLAAGAFMGFVVSARAGFVCGSGGVFHIGWRVGGSLQAWWGLWRCLAGWRVTQAAGATTLPALLQSVPTGGVDRVWAFGSGWLGLEAAAYLVLDFPLGPWGFDFML